MVLGYHSSSFSLFTKHRCKILNWLQDHPDARNQIMEETVRIVTNNKRGDSMQYNTRMWKSVDAPHCIVDTFLTPEAIALQEKEKVFKQTPLLNGYA